MTDEEWANEMSACGAAFKRLKVMSREPLPPNPPPQKGPSVFPLMCDVGLVHDEIERLPDDWRDPLLCGPTNNDDCKETR